MKLNIKNKIYIFVFSLIIIGIIVILVVSARMSKENKTISRYEISTNSVVFASDTNLVDTSLGGNIEQKWDGNYYYVSSNELSNDLGKKTIVYDKASEILKLFGESYRVLSNGDVVINAKISEITDLNTTQFFKIDDRVYLIVSKEIYTEQKNIYANKYLIVYIDKQGNASVLNDILNIKTINPMKLVFDNYEFDIANEKLIYDKTSIDLKLINGSTNEYDPSKTKQTASLEDLKNLSGAYNKLVSDFNQYTKNNNIVVSSNNQALVTNNYYIKQAVDAAYKNNKKANNQTNINKRISLRGAVASPTYIDVTYVVTDPEEKYQGVYLLVTGNIDGALATEKIIVDKYQTTYRVSSLSPKNEYTISLGYIEVVTNKNNEKELIDNIEDVINVRTTGPSARITIDKIANRRVYFTFKMYSDFAYESGNLVLYGDEDSLGSVSINATKALSSSGYSDSINLNNDYEVYTIKLENAKYAGKYIDSGIYKRFTYENAK